MPFLSNGKESNEEDESYFSKNSNFIGKKNHSQNKLYPLVLNNKKKISDDVNLLFKVNIILNSNLPKLKRI